MNYRDQEVSQIRLRCTRTGTLFTDPEFPACFSSLACDQEKLENLNVCWRRPTEICTHPRLMNYIRPSPARQGRLGNCWFVAACACLMRNPSVLRTVSYQDGSLKVNISGAYNTPIQPLGQLLWRI